jgi:phytoene synthase
MSLSAGYARCEQIARTAAANFYPAFLVLPRERRRAMYALYAFNRHTDDLADEPGSPADKRRALDAWRADLSAALAGDDSRPTLAALADSARRFGIPPQYFHDVIDGCLADLDARAMPSFADLYRYCYQVASAVGLACIHVWGFHGDRATAHAESAGVALQLTNILRDVGEDRDRGRVYLPTEDLDRFGCDRNRVCDDARCPSFQSLMAFEAGRARSYYDHARGLTPHLSPAGRAIYSVILGTYHRLLDRIESSGFDVLRQRVRVPAREKIALVARALPVRWGWLRG